MKPRPLVYDELLTPAEVGALFSVDANTVLRWANAGKFPEGSVVKTLGGRRRYKAAVVRDLLARPADEPRCVKCRSALGPLEPGRDGPVCVNSGACGRRRAGSAGTR